MNRVKLALNLNGLDASGKKVFGNKILTAITGNVNFTTPSPPLATLLTAINNLNAAINATVPSTIDIKSKEVYLEQVLNALKGYVEFACNNDEAIAVTSGFELRKPSPKKPKSFSAIQGEVSGVVHLQCPHIKKAAYVWEYINDPINQNTWLQFKVTNTTTTTISGLMAGNKYWFRVKAIVADEDKAYTDPFLVHVV